MTSEDDVWAVSNGNGPRSLTKVEREATGSSKSDSFASTSVEEKFPKKLTKITNPPKNSLEKVFASKVVNTEDDVLKFSQKANLVKELFDLDEVLSTVENSDWEKVRKSTEREGNLKNSEQLSPSDYINKLIAVGMNLRLIV